jgi:glycosyltransferase involved in cell wall biosynthesis
MRILTTLYYYRPHYSGLTVYTERLARRLASRGHQVTILTSRYDRSLAPIEVRDGVTIRRLPVAFRLSKGVILPTMPYWGPRLAARHDIVHLHVPQLDAAPMAIAGRLLRRPVVLTYHCDVRLPSSPVNWLAARASRLADTISARAADAVVANTRDYAEGSPFLRRFLPKLVVIPPPVEAAKASPATIQDNRWRWGIRPGDRVIGMAARLASEKGAEVLAQAMPRVIELFPTARVLYVGQHQQVLGEEGYARRLEPLLQSLGDHWRFLGMLSEEEMAAFYSLCEVTALPSLNSTESFGMVQVESMLCGTPVVASDIPGVREPTGRTGMGMVVPPGDADALAEALIRVLADPAAFRGRPEALQPYRSDQVAQDYERLFERLLAGEAPEPDR